MNNHSREQKKIIADTFSRSAWRYDQVAKVQQQAGHELLTVMRPFVKSRRTIGVLADVGCGTGSVVPEIITAYQPELYVGLDLAEGMLATAEKNHSLPVGRLQWLCNDAENLSLADHSVDIIYSNFSLQWCENLPSLMHDFYRVLKPGGFCCFTSLGTSTLHELRDAWSMVDDLVHVNHFYGQTHWLAAIEQQQFSLLHQYQTNTVMYYASVPQLLKSIKDIGANTVKGIRRQSLMGKQHFMAFVRAYEHSRLAQGLPTTYEINGWILKKNQSLL